MVVFMSLVAHHRSSTSPPRRCSRSGWASRTHLLTMHRTPACPPAAEFVFARLRYDSSGSNGKAYYHYRGRIWNGWETDYPEGDENFAHRLAQS